MIKGKVAESSGEKYQLKLENGESFVLEKKYLPLCLQESGKVFQLLFSGSEEAVVNQEEARSLLNHLLGGLA